LAPACIAGQLYFTSLLQFLNIKAGDLLMPLSKYHHQIFPISHKEKAGQSVAV
jgi:hypothetical protein